MITLSADLQNFSQKNFIETNKFFNLQLNRTLTDLHKHIMVFLSTQMYDIQHVITNPFTGDDVYTMSCTLSDVVRVTYTPHRAHLKYLSVWTERVGLLFARDFSDNILNNIHEIESSN